MATSISASTKTYNEPGGFKKVDFKDNTKSQYEQEDKNPVIPEQSGPLVAKKRSSLLPKINLGAFFSGFSGGSESNTATNTTNVTPAPKDLPQSPQKNDGEIILSEKILSPGVKEPLPSGSDATLQSLLKITTRARKDKTFYSYVMSQLAIDNATDREILKGLSWEDSLELAQYLEEDYTRRYILDIHDMDPNDSTSMKKLSDWHSLKEPLCEIKKGDLTKPLPRIVPKTLQFAETTVKTLETEAQIVELVKYHEGGVYYDKVDVPTAARQNFEGTPWLKIVSLKDEEIASRDFEACLNIDGQDLETRYNLLMLAEIIAKRPYLSVDFRLNLVAKFKPIAEAHYNFFHDYKPSNRDIHNKAGEALRIIEEFYENPIEMFIPWPKAEDKKEPGDAPKDTPEGDGNLSPSAEQTNTSEVENAGTETNTPSANEAGSSSEPTPEQIPSKQIAQQETVNTGSAISAILGNLNQPINEPAKIKKATSIASQNGNKPHPGVINPNGSKILVGTTAEYKPTEEQTQRPPMHVVSATGPSDRVKGLTTKSPWEDLFGNDKDSPSDLFIKDFLLNSKIAEEAQEGKDTRPDTMKNLESLDQMKNSYAESKTA